MTVDVQRKVQYRNSRFPIVDMHTFYAPALSPEATVLDLGASSAGFSRVLSSLYGCRCHAVEATGHGHAGIAETDLVSKHHYAIAGTNGPVELRFADGALSWGSIRPAGGHAFAHAETVPAITFASFLDEIGVPAPDLVKLDIEGAEYEVFETTPEAVLQGVGQFTVEFHDFMNPAWAEPTRRIINRMADLGFDVFSFSRRFHGDVLFLNRRAVALSPWQRFALGTVTKTYRGVRRYLSR